MSPIIRFSRDKRLPDNKKKAKKIKLMLAQYVILGDMLYKRGYSLPYLRCLLYNEANYVMREIHKGIYGNHSGVRSLALKAIRQRYFWHTMKKYTRKFVQQCGKCQRFSNIPRQHPVQLTLVTRPWSFAKWAVDIINPMSTDKWQTKFTEQKTTRFTWKSTICRFDIP